MLNRLHDLADRLDLVDRRSAGRSPVRSSNRPRSVAACRGQPVDQRGVLLEDVVALRTRAVLQLEHGLRVEQVDVALATPLVLATELQLAVGALLGPTRVRLGVAGGHLGGDLVEPDATEAADRAGEVLVDQLVAEADGLEDLRAGVAGDGADAHLAHHLQHALAGGLDVLLHAPCAGPCRRDR